MSGGFDALGLMPELIKAVNEMDWRLPTDVQEEAIPLILGGGDVMVAAETGSGKTAAFCLPIIQCVHELLRNNSRTKASTPNVAVTVIPPSNLDIRLNISDKNALCDVLENGYECFSGNKNWCGIRATHGVVGGRYYYEAIVTGDGICRVGWSTLAAQYEVGTDVHGYGYGGTAKKSHNSQFVDYGETYKEGDVIGCLIDLESPEPSISYAKNGKYLGTAFHLPVTANKPAYYPAIATKNAGVRVSFGGADHPTPWLSKTNIPSVAGTFVPMNLAIPSHISHGLMSAAAVNIPTATSGNRTPSCIIIEPSRELAEQVYHNIQQLLKYVVEPKLVPILLVGGDGNDKKHQLSGIKHGVDIVVGTPGKLHDFVVSQHILSLSTIKFYVLDEADQFASDAESLKMITALYNQCPRQEIGQNRLQVCFFSATLHSEEMTQLSAVMCSNPTWVDLKGKDAVPESVHHVVYRIQLPRDEQLLTNKRIVTYTDGVHTASTSIEDKQSQAIKEIKQHVLIKIIDQFNMSQCLIFCRTNVDCNNLEQFLITYGGGRKANVKLETGKENPYSCCVLAGMRSNSERKEALEGFRDGMIRFLICTDVAARGIDIKALPYVINMTLPDASEVESYIHRIGRVGRADKVGLAISIVTPLNVNEKVWYHKCKDRGVGCQNRKLLQDGGCCKWHTENQTLQLLNQRLMKVLPGGIPELTPSMELPACYHGTLYGESKQQLTTVLTSVQSAQVKRIERNASTVQELMDMEKHITSNFLSVHAKLHTRK